MIMVVEKRKEASFARKYLTRGENVQGLLAHPLDALFFIL